MFAQIASFLQFHWPGLVFTGAQALTLGLTIWITSLIVRFRIRRQLRGQDTAELRQLVLERDRLLSEQRDQIEDLEAENARLRSIVVANTALASQLLQNHQQVTDGAGEAHGDRVVAKLYRASQGD